MTDKAEMQTQVRRRRATVPAAITGVGVAALAIRHLRGRSPEGPVLGVAIEDLEVAFQPKVAFDDLRLVGAEALVRWPTGHAGALSATEIVARLDARGELSALTDHVLERSAELMVRMCAQQDFSLAVNVALDDLSDPQMVRRVTSFLDRHDLPPSSLAVEVTERVLLTDEVRRVGTIPALRDLGVTISLDDFGTGYSSLSNVRTFPVDEIKIDMAFVDRLAFQAADRLIAEAIVQLSRGLGIEVVAEGVESLESWAVLSGLGVDVAQGHNVSRALDEDAFLAWLDMWRSQGRPRAGGPGPPTPADR